MVPSVLLATGHTGGHVAPGLAVAEAIAELAPRASIRFAGPGDGPAGSLVRDGPWEVEPLEVAPLRGAGAGRWVRGLASLPATLVRADRLVRRLGPDVVVGTGGAVSGPLLAAAALRGRRALAFEANVEPGLANAWLAPLVDAVAVAWPEARDAFAGRAFVSGCPVRRAIVDVGGEVPGGGPSSRVRLLVLGGSGGADALDRAVARALPRLAAGGACLEVTHQAAPAQVESLRSAYGRAGIPARVEAFFPSLAPEYRGADLVVARAGGVTLGELAASGRPAVVVPLPAAGDHQRANARAWAEAGACVALEPEALDGERLAEALGGLLADPGRRERMRRAALARRRPEAARAIARRVLAMAADRSG